MKREDLLSFSFFLFPSSLPPKPKHITFIYTRQTRDKLCCTEGDFLPSSLAGKEVLSTKILKEWLKWSYSLPVGWDVLTVSTKSWHLPSTSTRINSQLLWPQAFKISPERSSGWRSGMRHSAPWENFQNRPSDSWIFSGDFMSQSLTSLHI